MFSVQEYVEGVDRIPGATITVEDAEMMQRMQDRGEFVSQRLCHFLDVVWSATCTCRPIAYSEVA